MFTCSHSRLKLQSVVTPRRQMECEHGPAVSLSVHRTSDDGQAPHRATYTARQEDNLIIVNNYSRHSWEVNELVGILLVFSQTTLLSYMRVCLHCMCVTDFVTYNMLVFQYLVLMWWYRSFDCQSRIPFAFPSRTFTQVSSRISRVLVDNKALDPNSVTDVIHRFPCPTRRLGQALFSCLSRA